MGQGEEWERPVEAGSVKTVLDWVGGRVTGESTPRFCSWAPEWLVVLLPKMGRSAWGTGICHLPGWTEGAVQKRPLGRGSGDCPGFKGSIILCLVYCLVSGRVENAPSDGQLREMEKGLITRVCEGFGHCTELVNEPGLAMGSSCSYPAGWRSP